MGTTFVNLHTRNYLTEEINKVLPGSIVRNFSDGWTTIVSEHFEVGRIDIVAKKLSKAIDQSVLSIEYFDDDLLRMTIYRNGKSLTSHINENGYGLPKKFGKPKVFVEELGFDLSEVKHFKEILACEDLGKKIELLQYFLGVTLWIDDRMLLVGLESDFRCQRNLSLIEEYIIETNKRNRIKNQTKVKLLMEFEGAVIEKLGDKKYLIGMPPYGIYGFEEEIIYKFVPKGTLESMQLNVSSFQYDRGTSVFYAAHEQFAFFCKIRKKYYLFDYDGRVISETPLSSTADFPVFVFEDGAFFAVNNETNTVAEYGPSLDKRWELPFMAYPSFFNQEIYLWRRNQSNASTELIKINRCGQVLASLKLESTYNAGINLFNSNKRVFCCYSTYTSGKHCTKILCLTQDLQYINEIDLDGSFGSAAIDSKNNKIFLYLLDKEINVIDTISLQIVSRRKWDAELFFVTVDLLGRAVVQIGNSTVVLLDSALNYVSQHRLKGYVYDCFTNEAGNLSLLTGTGETHEERKAKGMKIRVYEIANLSS